MSLPDCMYDYRPSTLSEDDEAITECDICDREIYSEDEVIELDGKLYCQECIEREHIERE